MTMNPLASLLGGGGDQGGAPAPPDEPEATASGDASSDLMAAIKSLQSFQDRPETDAVEDAEAAKLIASVKGFLAGRQKEKEAAMGTTSAHKFVSRQANASSGGSSGGY